MRGAVARNKASIVSGRSKSKSGRPTRTTSAAFASAEATWPAPPVTRIGPREASRGAPWEAPWEATSDMEPGLAVAQARQHLVLVGQDHVRRRHRPVDADIGIVPDHATLRRLIVGTGDLV